MTTPHHQHATTAAVREAMADLERRVRERRRLLGEPSGGGAGHDEIRAVADNWFVSAHLPITWEIPLIGRAIALAKRVTRLLLRWYINPIVDQQNDYNAAVARAFVHVAAQQESLAQALAAVERRVTALEVAGRQSPVASGHGTGVQGAADEGEP
jgi:hypothetical protein